MGSVRHAHDQSVRTEFRAHSARYTASAGMMGALIYALRRLRKGWRSGELLILVLALTVAVAAMSAVSLFYSSLRQAIENQTGETLGADLIFRSRAPVASDILQAIGDSGSRTIGAVTFASVALHGETTALASVKAVEPGYPLRGALRITDEPFGMARKADAIPARGEAWVDLRLWQELGLSLASEIQLGALTLRVTALVTEEPGRGMGFTDLAPRLLIHHDDLDASGLLGPGSRAQYLQMVAGSTEQLAPLQQLALPSGVDRLSPQEAGPELVGPVNRAGEFLALARLSATLMAAVAIALCAWQWGQKLRDEVAILKCLGASNNFILDALTIMLLLLGAVAALAGILIGLGAQQMLAALLGSLMQLTLPAPPLLLPLARAGGLALVLLFGFALPPIFQARATSPIRVFQRDEHGQGLFGARLLPMLAAVAAVGAVLWLQFGDWMFALVLLGGIAGAALVLALMGALLVMGLAPLKRAVGTSWRFGLGNVARRRRATVVQVVALGLSLHALLLVVIVHKDLLSTWRAALPADTPNQFLINIQASQIPALRDFFSARKFAEPVFWPMARGRMTHLRGEPITADSFKDDPRASYWVNRDFNLSWTDTIGDDNKITEGQWWGAEGRGKALLSADKSAVEGLGLAIGDTLTLDFAGESIEFTVHNFREVKWDSFRPNFFLLAPPGVLEDKAAAQWLTSFYLARDQRGLLRDLIRAFPNVTVLDIEAIMNQVRTIMDRIVSAVEFVFLFTLAAGLTVLLAAIEATRGDRVRETGVLRALGARSGLIMRGLLAEYAVLGLLAGTVAAIAAQVVAWLLAEQVFKIPYGLRPMLWLAGAGTGAGLVTLLGWLSLRGTLNTPPHQVLRTA